MNPRLDLVDFVAKTSFRHHRRAEALLLDPGGLVLSKDLHLYDIFAGKKSIYNAFRSCLICFGLRTCACFALRTRL